MLASLTTELPGLTLSDVVKPDPKAPDAGVLMLSFARPPYRGKVRAPIAKTGAIAVLACFWNVREPVACEAACNQLINDTCVFADRCKVASKADCLAQSTGALDCSKAIGVTASFPTCVSELPAAVCPTGAFALPTSCKGTIKLFQTAPPEQGPGWHAELLAPLEAVGFEAR